MTKGLVSIIIPSAKERFLQPTITSLLSKAAGSIEILVVLDGYWPDPPLDTTDKRLHLLHKGQQEGMRPAINDAARVANGEFLLKIDGHCDVASGYDVTLKADIEPDWVVVPRRYSLDAEKWRWLDNGKKPVDYHFLSYPFEHGRPGHGLHGQVWPEKARVKLDVLIDDEMSSQGSCWFMTAGHFQRMGELETFRYGQFVQEFQEIGNKTWLGGGAVKVNKKTWYAHLHKGKEYGRGYFIDKGSMSRGAQACVDWWMNDRWPDKIHGLQWLIEHFWPVPSWPQRADGSLDWDVVQADTKEFTEKLAAGEPVGI